MTPSRCVIDTNVAVVANRRPGSEDAACGVRCARALRHVMQHGHVFIDDAGAIVAEYRRNLTVSGEPRAGNIFLKWLLTHEWNPARVTRVRITPRAGDPDDFEELPAPAGDVRYDPADRKFLAVAAAHPEHPPVLQALDSKWWGWQEALAAAGVSLWFLCPREIARKHEEKSES